MIPNYILVPVAYLTAAQCLGLFLFFRWLFPQGGWCSVGAGFAGIASGFVLGLAELYLLDVASRWRKKKPP